MIWILFTIMIILFLAFDLGLFNRKAHIQSIKETTTLTTLWVSIALLFNFVVYWIYSRGLVSNPTQLVPFDAAITYLTGYLIEFTKRR